MENSQNNNRMVLLLIAGIPLIMILAATWLWYFVVRGDLDLVAALGTANSGELVQPPRQIDAETLMTQSAVPYSYAEHTPARWTMLIPGGPTCATFCERNLYLTRQIHLGMGKDFNRLRRMYVSETPLAGAELAVVSLSDEAAVPDSLSELLDTEHRGTQVVRIEPGAAERLFPEWIADPDTWYLVDPRGWIMMSYDAEVSYKDVISDLKFLLKNSSS
tara:strand:+ start:5342 stop:5995 length:654 start_codon:yes stop_codon:yes gene_type:complete